MHRRVYRTLFVWLGATACAAMPPPRAVVTVHGAGDAGGNTVLALPTTCVSSESILCDQATYYTSPANAPKQSFDEIIAPIVRLKLELAGYTVVDPRTLRLETAGRTDVTVDNEPSTRVEDVPTVATLSPEEVVAAAAAIQLASILTPRLYVNRRGYEIWFELVLELRAVRDGAVRWIARCGERMEVPSGTANLIASCVGDGVLAWRAPGALIGRTQ